MTVTLSDWGKKNARKKQTPMPLFQAIQYVHRTYVHMYLCIVVSKYHTGVVNATPNRCLTGLGNR